MMRSIARRISVVTVGMAMLLAACSSTPAIKKADYLTKANAICSSGSSKLESESKVVNENDVSSIRKFVTGTYVPEVRSEIAQIEKLGYPKGDKATLQSIFAQTEAVLDNIIAHTAKYVSPTAGDPFAAVDKRLKAYGLTKCGSNQS